jgi:small subunit ribosomal protein S11
MSSSSKKNMKNTSTTKKKQGKLSVDVLHVYIKATYNNFLVYAALPNGDVVHWVSGGCYAKNSRKNSPSLAEEAGQTLGKTLASRGVSRIFIFLSGINNTRDAVIRGLHVSGLSIGKICERTRFPHNGCRAKKKRRV